MPTQTPEMNQPGKSVQKLYTLGEEIFNAVSHGVGSLLSIIGTTIMITLSSMFGNVTAIVSSIIYGISLILLYTFSTLYHALVSDPVKQIFRIFDHSTIFLLIAGSYTPYLLILLRDSTLAKWVLASLWIISVIGIALNIWNLKKFSKLSMVLYVAMGWAIVVLMPEVISVIEPGGFWLMLGGGIFYTVGIVFYALKKIPYMHSIWHLFVLAGSVLQFLSILLYVLPLTF